MNNESNSLTLLSKESRIRLWIRCSYIQLVNVFCVNTRKGADSRQSLN